MSIRRRLCDLDSVWSVDLIPYIVAVLLFAAALAFGSPAAGEEFRPTTNAYRRSESGGVISYTPLSGVHVRVTPDDPGPPDPGPDPPDDPSDKWGLRAKAAAEARAVGDGNGNRVAIAYLATAQGVEKGIISQSQVPVMLDLSLRAVLDRDDYERWQGAIGRIRESLNAADIDTQADAVQAMRDVAAGLRDVDGASLARSTDKLTQAADLLLVQRRIIERSQDMLIAYQAQDVDAAFFDQFLRFITEILPLILELIKLFGGSTA